MKSYTESDLLSFSNNLSDLKNAINQSWGDVFLSFEEKGIFPEKELLIELKDAAVFPFLFKNYRLNKEDRKKIKDIINLTKNSLKLSNSEELVSNIISKEDINIIKNEVFDIDNEDFTNYDVIVKSILNNRPIEFIEGVHDIALLDRLSKDNVNVLFDVDLAYESSNTDWLLNILAKTSPDDFNEVSIPLMDKVTFFILEWEASLFNAKQLLTCPRFLNNFYQNYEYIYLSDFKKMGISGVDEDVVYKSFEKAFNNEKKGDDGYLNLSGSMVNFIKKNLDVSKVKALTNNRIPALWDEGDFKEAHVRQEFLRKALPSFAGVLRDNEDNLEIPLDEIRDAFTREDAINFFNFMIEVENEIKNDYVFQYNSNLHNLREINFNEDKLELVAFLLGKFYDNPEGLNPVWNVNKMANSIFALTENEVWSSFFKEEGNPVRELFSKMLLSSDFAKFENSYPVFSAFKNDMLFRASFNDDIERFLTNNVTFDKAIIVFEFYGNNVSLISKVLEQLEPLDVSIIKEMGFNVPDDVYGSVKASLSDVNTNILLRRNKDEIEDFNVSLMSMALKSPLFKRGLMRTIKTTEDFQNTFCFLKYLDEESKKVLISTLVDKIKEDISVIENLTDDDLDLLANYRQFRDLIPKKKEFISYKKFMVFVGILEDLRKSFSSEDCPDEVKKKITEIEKEIKKIPKDVMSSYVQSFVDNGDWVNYQLNKTYEIALQRAIIDTSRDLTRKDVANILNFPNSSQNNVYFNCSPDKINKSNAHLIVFYLNKNLNKNNYSLYLDAVKPLFEDKESRKCLFEAIKEKPLLMLASPIFKFSLTTLPDNEIKSLLFKGLDVLRNEPPEIYSRLIKGWEDKDEICKNSPKMSMNLTNSIKNESLFIKDRVLLNKIVGDTVPNYMTINNFFEFLNNANKLSTSLKNAMLEKFEVNENDNIKYKNIDEKFKAEFSLPVGSLFPEILNHKFIKENSLDFVKISEDYKIKFKADYINNCFVMGNFIHITEDFESILEDTRLNLSFSNDFEKALSLFVSCNQTEKNILDYFKINDNNFNEVMYLLIKGCSDKGYYYNHDHNKTEKEKVILSEIVRYAFIDESLSELNKVKLLNAVELSIISRDLLNGDCLGGYGKEVLTKDNVLEVAIAYKNRKNINNMFTSFDFDNDIGDDYSSSFKI